MQTVACECGCGQAAPVTRGIQRRFVHGHNGRLNLADVRPQILALPGALNPGWRGADAHPNGIHTWLRRNYPKRGACERCGVKAKTDYAFKRHPEPYTRERDDYAELCRGCHVRFDSSCKP